jgi:hypothetical protein
MEGGAENTAVEAVTSAWGGVMTTALVATGIFVNLYLNFAVLLQRMYVFTYLLICTGRTWKRSRKWKRKGIQKQSRLFVRIYSVRIFLSRNNKVETNA